MSVTERLMAAGEWDVQLVEDTPRRILEAIDIETAGFGQLVILPTRLDPRAHTDATLLSLARYTGIFRKQEGDFRLSGPGLPILLMSADESAAAVARALGIEFVDKNSPRCVRQLHGNRGRQR